MTTDKTLRFRPAVVVCVGPQGREVGAQLETLLAEWVEQGDPRRAGVAVIEVDAPVYPSYSRGVAQVGEFDTGEDDMPEIGPLVGGWMQSRLDAERATGTPRHAGDVPLSRLIVEALRGREGDVDDPARAGVLDDQAVWNIEEAGYVVPRAMAVVWVVAAASSPLLEPVTRDVRRGLESEHVDNWVLLALPNAYPRDPAQHTAQAQACAEQPWGSLLVGEAGRPPLATYAYVFETQSERGTFWEGEDDVAFAAAEAIFVLTASGITTTREYEDMLRRSLPSMIGSPYERMSGVGTSRLLFPRAYVEQYCASELGAELMRLWARSEEMAVAPVAASTQKAAARALLTQLRAATGELEAHSRGGRPSPKASFEGVKRARAMPRPVADGGLIFAHFSPRELDRLADGRRDLPTRLHGQREKAEEGFAVWSQAIRPAWERCERSLDRTLTATAGELVLEGPGGVARARTYLDYVRTSLITERERMARQREGRALAYERFLRRMEAVAQGPWLAEPQPVPQPVAQSLPPRIVPQTGPVPVPSPFPLPAPQPPYQTYPPTTYPPARQPAASFPSYPGAYSPGYAPGYSPAYAPGFAPGLASNVAPPVSPVLYTPGYASYAGGDVPRLLLDYAPLSHPPIVPVLSSPAQGPNMRPNTGPNMDWSGPWRWGAEPGSQSSGVWRMVNVSGAPAFRLPDASRPIANDAAPSGPMLGFSASTPAMPYAPSASAPYAPPVTGPAALDNPAEPDLMALYESSASLVPELSNPSMSSASSSAGAGSWSAWPDEPLSAPIAQSYPASADPNMPVGSAPRGYAQSQPAGVSGSQSVPPLPSYLAPAPPAYQTAPSYSTAAPMYTTGAPGVVSAEPPSREERLVANLATRVRYYETRRPTLAALMAVSLAALAPLVFLAQGVVPHSWLDRPYGMLYLTLTLAALVAAVAAGYAWVRASQLRRAVEDLRAAYVRSFADRCERHEDARREAVVAGLLAHTRRMVDRLGQWDTFASTMADTLQGEAGTIDRRLFDGALGRRNVLVANRRRLHPQSYRLANLAVDVGTKRRRHPMEGYAWHSDLAAMLPRLRDSLRGGKSLLEADPDELVVPIRSFCAGIVRPYLNGEIADISAAFEMLPQSESTMYLDALMARSAILYRPADPPRGAISFVAAHDEHQGYVSGKRQQAEPITLPIEDRGWLGVVRLFPGGSMPTFRLPDETQLRPMLSEPLWQSDEMAAVVGRNGAIGGFGQAASPTVHGPMGARAPQTQLRQGPPSFARAAAPSGNLGQLGAEESWLLDSVAQAAPMSSRTRRQ